MRLNNTELSDMLLGDMPEAATLAHWKHFIKNSNACFLPPYLLIWSTNWASGLFKATSDSNVQPNNGSYWLTPYPARKDAGWEKQTFAIELDPVP